MYPQDAKPEELPMVFSNQKKSSLMPPSLTKTITTSTPLNEMIYNCQDLVLLDLDRHAYNMNHCQTNTKYHQ
ncbi:hypothetical protein YC2023_015706 [Brassica napus]